MNENVPWATLFFWAFLGFGPNVNFCSIELRLTIEKENLARSGKLETIPHVRFTRCAKTKLTEGSRRGNKMVCGIRRSEENRRKTGAEDEDLVGWKGRCDRWWSTFKKLYLWNCQQQRLQPWRRPLRIRSGTSEFSLQISRRCLSDHKVRSSSLSVQPSLSDL